MERFPIFLCLKDRLCVVVGAGQVALRKAQALVKSGARLQIIAPDLAPEMQELIVQHPTQIKYLARTFSPNDLNQAFLIIAATNNRAVNREIAQLAHERNLLVNVVDNTKACSFIVPSVVNRDPVQIAVSTGGASPVLARQIRMKLETMIPSSCGELATITEEYRDTVKQRFADPEQRKHFWEQTLRGPFAELVYAGNTQAARQMLDAMLANPSAEPSVGEVYLVGAGPGDPDLLTFRALRLMQQADVVVYDRLVAKSILNMASQDAERIYVGKEKANHVVRQEKINDLLVDLAKQGKRVLRLKGGDPFIFGRGGEEIETLAENGIPFQVVPGVTAASGCASYAGIPLTHRDYAQSCTFATGHLKDGTIDLDWEKLAQPRQTVVFYMGLTGIQVISKQLVAHGMSPETPAALVEQGTTRNQRVHIGTLATLPSLVSERAVRAPTLTIVGDVVRLHEKLHWYQPERHVAASEFSRNPVIED
ncbi:siroheme synthase CysG [Thiolinea disciformis]|uniref:siroheme synthase CysG n=1 Tax=Thiolinea disciformis TaxID=125614 RepID=UPI000381F760|nr:siroheme synthase CysG [Thiolinea disciformis]